MTAHDYSPRDCLDFLLRKLHEPAPELVSRMKVAIDAGKEELVESVEASQTATGRQKRKQYQKSVSYSDEEALTVAMTVIRTHLLENRIIINSAHEEFGAAALSGPDRSAAKRTRATQAELFQSERNRQDVVAGHEGEPKSIVIEAEPETTQEKQGLEDLKLAPVPEDQIETLKQILDHLHTLVSFEGGRHGDTARS